MRLVIVESPFRATAEHTQEQHELYLHHCLADCFSRGEAPYASHLLGPAVLDDSDPAQRHLGIAAGFAWGAHADGVAVYGDMGISSGMKEAIAHYQAMGKPIERRVLDYRIVRAILEG